MFELIYPGRSMVLDSPYGVEELTRRLEQAFDGTVAGGRVRLIRRVRGRNSFRPVVDGRILPGSGGSRLTVRLRLHPLILGFGVVFAVIAGTVAAVASPEIPPLSGSPLLARVLAMAAVAFLFAFLAGIEARTSTRLLANVVNARPTPQERPLVTSQRCLLLALVLSLKAGPASGDSGTCPLRAADLEKLTPYRWHVAQYQADRAFIPNGSIRIDFCELIGKDAKGVMRTGVMVNIARGANAAAFARHWRAACADSIMPDARGTVQPVPGVPGGQRCATANGSSSFYWIESPGHTIQVEPETVGAEWATIVPQLLAAAAQ